MLTHIIAFFMNDPTVKKDPLAPIIIYRNEWIKFTDQLPAVKYAVLTVTIYPSVLFPEIR